MAAKGQAAVQKRNDKRTLANDIHLLAHEHLKIEQTVIMVGHDIGLMVAYAYAKSYRDGVSHLVVMDAPLPGTTVIDSIRSELSLWHFDFHGARDIPKILVVGRNGNASTLKRSSMPALGSNPPVLLLPMRETPRSHHLIGTVSYDGRRCRLLGEGSPNPTKKGIS